MWAAGFYSPARLGETACILALGSFPSLPSFSLVNTDSSLAYSTLLMYTLYFRVCRMALAELQLKCCHSFPFQTSSAAGEVMFEPRIALMRAGVHIHTCAWSVLYLCGPPCLSVCFVLFFCAYYEWYRQRRRMCVCILGHEELIFIAFNPVTWKANYCPPRDFILAASNMDW